MKFFAQVFKDRKGNEFFFNYRDYVSTDRQKAQEMGWGISLVEAIVCDAKSVEVREFDSDNLPHIIGWVGPLKLTIVGGPEFTKIFYDEVKQLDAPLTDEAEAVR